MSSNDFPTEMLIEEHETLAIDSSNKTYQYWKIQVPKNCVVSLLFENIDTPSVWDNFTYLRMDNKDDGNLQSINSCSSSTNVIDINGQFKTKYTKFTSRSSSLKIIFFTTTPLYKMTLSIKAMKREGNHIIQIWLLYDNHTYLYNTL